MRERGGQRAQWSGAENERSGQRAQWISAKQPGEGRRRAPRNYSAISALHNKDLNLSAKKLSKIAEYIPLIPCWSEIFFVPLHL